MDLSCKWVIVIIFTTPQTLNKVLWDWSGGRPNYQSVLRTDLAIGFGLAGLAIKNQAYFQIYFNNLWEFKIKILFFELIQLSKDKFNF